MYFVFKISKIDNRVSLFLANVYFKHQASSQAVVEGEKLVVKCKVFGTDPEVSWVVGKLN